MEGKELLAARNRIVLYVTQRIGHGRILRDDA
jgi:hypothetical protein